MGAVWQVYEPVNLIDNTSFSAAAASNFIDVQGSFQPMHTFFDTLGTSTSSLRSYAFTTYDTFNGHDIVGSIDPDSVPRTFYYQIADVNGTPIAGDYEAPKSMDVSYDGVENYFPPIVDIDHKLWMIGAQGSTTKRATIQWNESQTRPELTRFENFGLSLTLPGITIEGFEQFRAGITTPDRYSVTQTPPLMIAAGMEFSFSEQFTPSFAGVTALYGAQAGPNEFSTFGGQLGPMTIRPVYSMMDDVYAFKATDFADKSGSYKLASNRGAVGGFRPGLRGTEASGSWNFMFGTSAGHQFDPSTGYAASADRGIWLRQVRLETVTNQYLSLNYQNPARARLFNKPPIVPNPDGPHLESIMSGNAAWDTGLTIYQSIQPSDYGRSVSISADVQASVGSFAVVSFITGSLYETLLEQGETDPSNPPWFLGGPTYEVPGSWFGTPYIPDKYMEMSGSAEQIDAQAAQEILLATTQIQTLVPGANDLQSLLNRQGYSKTTLERWNEVIASQSADTGSSYWPPNPPR